MKLPRHQYEVTQSVSFFFSSHRTTHCVQQKKKKSMMTTRFYMCKKVILQGVGVGVNDAERGRRLIQFPPTILVAGLPLLKKMSGEKQG